MTGLCLGEFVWFGALLIFLQAGFAVEGIFLGVSFFDGGISNVRVGCVWYSSKSVSIFIAYKTCVRFGFVDLNERWWLVDCFGNGLEDISLDVVAVEVWEWELFLIYGAFRFGYLWLYGSSHEWLRLLKLLTRYGIGYTYASWVHVMRNVTFKQG